MGVCGGLQELRKVIASQFPVSPLLKAVGECLRIALLA